MSENDQEQYEQKKTTYEEIVRGLKSPISVATGNASAKAHDFFFALGEHGGHIDKITLGLGNTFEAEYPIVYREGVEIRTGFYGPLERALLKKGHKIHYRPTQFCDGNRFLD